MKEKAQDPLAARSTSRPIFASVMGHRRSLVDTCKSSSVLVVSYSCSLHVFVCVFAINRLCNDELSTVCTLWTRYDSDHVVKWACPRSAGARLSTKRDWVRG